MQEKDTNDNNNNNNNNQNMQFNKKNLLKIFNNVWNETFKNEKNKNKNLFYKMGYLIYEKNSKDNIFKTIKNYFMATPIQSVIKGIQMVENELSMLC